MTQVDTLERQQDIASDILDPWLAKEVEALLEWSDDSLEVEQDELGTREGSWYFRMPQPGVRYYSF